MCIGKVKDFAEKCLMSPTKVVDNICHIRISLRCCHLTFLKLSTKKACSTNYTNCISILNSKIMRFIPI